MGQIHLGLKYTVIFTFFTTVFFKRDNVYKIEMKIKDLKIILQKYMARSFKVLVTLKKIEKPRDEWL